MLQYIIFIHMALMRYSFSKLAVTFTVELNLVIDASLSHSYLPANSTCPRHMHPFVHYDIGPFIIINSTMPSLFLSPEIAKLKDQFDL
jgi:hypothetical protein